MKSFRPSRCWPALVLAVCLFCCGYGQCQVLSLSSDAAAAPIHTAINLTATVEGGASGMVTFLDGGIPLVAVPLSRQGTAVLSIASLAQGTHTVTAVYTPAVGAVRFTGNPVSLTIAGLAAPVVPAGNEAFIAGKPGGVNMTALPADASGTLTVSENGTPLGSVSIAGLGPVGRQYHALGDSITQGVTVPDLSLRYPALVAKSLGLTLGDYAVAGDEACDTLGVRILRQNLGATQNNAPLYSLMIGTTDVDARGAGPHEAIFRECHKATLAWLAVPREYKVLAGDPAVTSTGAWTHNPSANDATYSTLYNNSSSGTATFPLTTSGGPIYLWYLQSDRLKGTFTVAVDGADTGSVYSTTPVDPIYTINNPDQSGFVLLRLPVAPGAHQVVVTELGGTIGILGVGTPPSPGAASVHPVVLVAELPWQLNTNPVVPPAQMLAYVKDIQDDLALLQPDGLNLVYTPTRALMLGTPAEMNDQAHPSALGQAHLAQAVQAVLAGIPAPSFNAFTSAAIPWLYLTFSQPGAHTIQTAYSGDATYAPSVVSTVLQVQPRAVTTTSVQLPAQPTQANQPVVLSASVSPATAAGTVSFTEGPQYLGSADLAGGTVSLPVTLGAGRHVLLAQYSGDPLDAPSTATATLQVLPAAVQVGLDALPSETVFGTPLALTGSVSQATASGSLTFVDDFTPLFAGAVQPPPGQAALVHGVAVLDTSALLPGTHRLSAVYAGDANDLPGSSAPRQTVVDPVPTTALISAPGTTAYGTAMTLTAIVAPAGTGKVSFQDSASGPLGEATLQNGIATLTVPQLPVGIHALTASYAGDATHAASTSTAVTAAVSQAPSTTSLLLPPGTLEAGSPVTVHVAVTPAGATGMVTLLDARTGPLGKIQLLKGAGTLTLGSLAAGNYNLTAEYGGDGNTLASASPLAALQITSIPVNMTLTAPASSMYGEPLALLAAMQPADATGPVRFVVDGLPQGTATLSGGAAQWQAGPLAAGSHTFRATYAGDALHAQASSAAATVQISEAITATTLALAQASVTAGSPLAFHVTVTGGRLSPGGTVAVHVGSAVVASGRLTAGGVGTAVATLTASATQPGNFTAVAFYGGDPNNAASDSTAAPVSYSVQPVPVTGTITLSSAEVPPQATVTVGARFTASGMVPVGTVSFAAGGMVFAAVPLDGLGNASASMNASAPGSLVITATLQPTGLFAAASAAPQTVTVTPPLVAGVQAPNVSLGAGASTTDALQLQPLSGFQGNVAVQCISPVAYLTCQVDAPSVITGPVTATVRLNVASTLTASLEPRGSMGLPVAAGLLLLLPPLLRGRRCLTQGLLAALVLAVLGGLAGCAQQRRTNSIPAGTQVVQLQTTAAGVTLQTGIAVTITN